MTVRKIFEPTPKPEQLGLSSPTHFKVIMEQT